MTGTEPAEDRRHRALQGLLEAVDRLSAQDARRLADEWQRGDEERRSAARRAVRRAIAEHGLTETLASVEERLTRWGRGRMAGITQGALFGRMDDADLTDARAAAAPPAIDAAAALLVQDLIPQAEFDALFEAWGQAIVLGGSGRAPPSRVGPGGAVRRVAGFMVTGVPFDHDQDR